MGRARRRRRCRVEAGGGGRSLLAWFGRFGGKCEWGRCVEMVERPHRGCVCVIRAVRASASRPRGAGRQYTAFRVSSARPLRLQAQGRSRNTEEVAVRQYPAYPRHWRHATDEAVRAALSATAPSMTLAPYALRAACPCSVRRCQPRRASGASATASSAALCLILDPALLPRGALDPDIS